MLGGDEFHFDSSDSGNSDPLQMPSLQSELIIYSCALVNCNHIIPLFSSEKLDVLSSVLRYL